MVQYFYAAVLQQQINKESDNRSDYHASDNIRYEVNPEVNT